MFILHAGIFMVLAGMAYQDFRYRGIYWWMFPLLLIFFVIIAFQLDNLKIMVFSAIKSCLFLAAQLIILTIYLSLRQKRLINILTGFFGLGDLLFLVVISMGLSFLNYIVFYITSLMLVIVFSVFALKKSNANGYKIPLAGYQAIFFGLLLLVEGQVPKLSLHADEFLNNLLVYGN